MLDAVGLSGVVVGLGAVAGRPRRPARRPGGVARRKPVSTQRRRRARQVTTTQAVLADATCRPCPRSRRTPVSQSNRTWTSPAPSRTQRTSPPAHRHGGAGADAQPVRPRPARAGTPRRGGDVDALGRDPSAVPGARAPLAVAAAVVATAADGEAAGAAAPPGVHQGVDHGDEEDQHEDCRARGSCQRSRPGRWAGRAGPSASTAPGSVRPCHGLLRERDTEASRSTVTARVAGRPA